MFFASSSFADNSINSKEIKFEERGFEIINFELINKNVGDIGWVATCYVLVRNTETGETRKVYGIGYGATQSEALSNCGANARESAEILYG